MRWKCNIQTIDDSDFGIGYTLVKILKVNF